MSEADSAAAGREEIWLEQYRPERFSDIVGQESIVERLESYVARDDIPNMLFAGPAGVGKCVTGDTPVLTDEGLAAIEDVVGTHDGFQRHDEQTQVLSYTEQGSFEYRTPSHRFGKQADELLRVQTRDGNTLTVTPEHKLLALTHDGLEWKPAAEFDAGDRVARPLSAPLPETDCALDWETEMNGKRIFVHVSEEFSRVHEIPFEENLVGMKKRAVRGLRNGGSVEEVAAETGIKPGTVRAAKREFSDADFDTRGTVCSLDYLRQLDVSAAEVAKHVEQIQYVSVNNQRSESITPPSTVTPELARWVGLAISEARIEDGTVKFYNTDEELLETFETLSEQLFDVTPRTGTQKGVSYVELAGRTLTEYLSACFDVFPLSTGETIGGTMLRADEESRRAFLRAVFDAEGHVTEHGILELTQKDGDIITLLSYLLAGFGVPSRRKEAQKQATNGSDTSRTYHTLYVSSADHLEGFHSEVGFSIDEKSQRLVDNTNRDSNPNDDTILTQQAVPALCDQLNLNKREYVPDTLNPDSPGRRRYQRCLSDLLDDANARLESVQNARERLTQLSSAVDTLTTVPVKWEQNRKQLAPLETRREVAAATTARKDYLLEYARGNRVPYTDRAGTILQTVSDDEFEIPLQQVQRELDAIIETLDISYATLVEDTDLRSPDVGNLLNQDDHEIGSLCRFKTVAEQLDAVLSEMASVETLEQMQTLQRVASSELYFDEVEAIQQVEDSKRVYDLTVPGVHNYVAGTVPTVMHNTTSAVTIAKELYGEGWEEHFLELNASDERGIDVVRDRIKSFARTSFGGVNYRIIFLDEADALTSDAQSALRRTMEQFSNNVRFILSCNYSSQIIDPIQSRCTVFRFSPLSDEAVETQIRRIAEDQGIELTEDGIEALVYVAGGDMRAGINGLQAAAVTGGVVDEEAVFEITSTARPEDIEEMVTLALDGDFTASRSQLDRLLTEEGIAGGDIIDQLHRSVWEFGLGDEAAVRVLDRIGEADYRITEGANERIQLEALLAALALEE